MKEAKPGNAVRGEAFQLVVEADAPSNLRAHLVASTRLEVRAA
jgi:hypothetical protein